MINRNSIELGDVVTVNFHGAGLTLCVNGVVGRKPVATGDSWVIKDLRLGCLHYISEGCTITKSLAENERKGV